MDYQTTVSSGNSVGLETSQSAVSQAEVDQAEADYCEAMCQFGRNSAEVLVSHRYWMHLKTQLRRRLAVARVQRARSRTQGVPPAKRSIRTLAVHDHAEFIRMTDEGHSGGD